MGNKKQTFSAAKRRNFMAAVLALLTATVMIPGMTTYLPFELEQKILVPILLFPLIWVGLFIYCYMANKAWQPLVVMLILLISHIFFSYNALTSGALS
ncbi:hypothetical protein CWB99_09720 [Pseudoalteromonas rubra]|uniref:Uncharacterized protein n=1 Tax=Pseudoalteromonas rubra TaxID=43658 RepID=A0A5S3WN74_9GAMM|nr:hypothetical protein [Pseudoalteromonas rubra]TMP29039.1 hypothetical protein CWB99_09720 [Pseudoalteromonas rubra]TMP33596.1 hypothetical protein CWC00_10610 [Pseudoalteromonas rubra]